MEGRHGPQGRPGVRRRSLRLSEAPPPTESPPGGGEGRRDRRRRSRPRVQAIRDIEPRPLTLRVWHHRPPGERLLWFRSPATYGGRYQRAGSRGAWYASSRERAAWAELLRHHQSTELTPFEVRRRVGRAVVRDLRVLDLTDPDLRARLGVTEEDLVDDDLAVCQAIGEAARAAGFDGLLTPSAAIPGEATLAVFGRGMRRVIEEHSRVQRPPRSLLRLLDRIRR